MDLPDRAGIRELLLRLGFQESRSSDAGPAGEREYTAGFEIADGDGGSELAVRYWPEPDQAPNLADNRAMLTWYASVITGTGCEVELRRHDLIVKGVAGARAVAPQTDTSGGRECADCLARPGEAHESGCDWARCPDCGEQLLLHLCDLWDEDASGPDRPAVWHGIDQQAEVARTLNWWTTAHGIDHLVEDYTRVLFATGLGQVSWDPLTQKYAIGQIDEVALDRAIADSL